jgi:4-amino-4-deoxy-L-arabinose transferase-like glycosyltransferase
LLRCRAAGRDADLFLLVWIIPSWIVFELSPAKLPHYTMPLYPALALLGARALLAAQARLRVGSRFGVWGWWSVAAALPLVAAAAVWFSDIAPEARISAVVFVVGLIGLPVWGTMLVAVQFIRGHRWASAAITAAGAGAFALALLLHGIVPSLVRQERPRFLSGNLTERFFAIVRDIDPQGRRPLASVYREDSVVFQSRGRVEKIAEKDQAAWLAMNPSGILIGIRSIDAAHRNAFELGEYAVLAPAHWSDGKYSEPPPRSTTPRDQP